MSVGISLYKFSEVEAKTAKPQTVDRIIADVLRHDNDAAYIEVESFLRPPGVCGSRQFDQHSAIAALLKHDDAQSGLLADSMAATGMSQRLLWDRLQRVLRGAGFVMSHGRLTGISEEHVAAENGDSGQPDID